MSKGAPHVICRLRDDFEACRVQAEKAHSASTDVAGWDYETDAELAYLHIPAGITRIYGHAHEVGVVSYTVEPSGVLSVAVMRIRVA